MSEFSEHVEEVEAYKRAQEEIARQHDEANKAEIETLLDELTPEQLKTLQKMLVMCTNDTDNAWSLHGVISGCLMWKHGRSWNGDESPLADPAMSIALKLRNASGEPATEMERLEMQAQDEYANNLKIYNLMPDPENEGTFKCGNCGQWYISLEDRMLKPPGPAGCGGCKQKSMWG